MGRILLIGAIVATAAVADAQSINVNFAPPGNTPSPGYAAAGAAGTWNTVTGIAGMTFDLVDTAGSPSGVTLSQSPTTTLLATRDPSVSGDDATLLDNGLVTSGAETCLSFQGFHPGSYEVLIYAWLPGQPGVKSRTRQDEAPSTQDVGGAWPGMHAEGITYARYVVTVGADGVLPAHSGLVPGAPDAALNGVQIRPLSATGGDAGAGSSDGGIAPPDAGPGGAETSDAGGTRSAMAGGCNAGQGSGPAVALVLALLLACPRRTRAGRGDRGPAGAGCGRALQAREPSDAGS